MRCRTDNAKILLFLIEDENEVYGNNDACWKVLLMLLLDFK
jgi:hypothetical protein